MVTQVPPEPLPVPLPPPEPPDAPLDAVGVVKESSGPQTSCHQEGQASLRNMQSLAL
jgi:hypothetical protein